MPSEDLEKFRIIETKKTYRPTVRDWLVGNFKGATWDQCRLFVFSFYPPGPDQLAVFHDISTWERDGKNPAEVECHGGSFQDYLLAAASKYRNDLDSLSWVGSIVPPLDETETTAWRALSTDYFLSPFTQGKVSGGFLTITGKPRMGKTGIGCLYAEMILKEYAQTEVLTNIPLEKPVDHVRPASSTTALLRGVADALIADRRWWWIFDEPSLSGWMKMDAPTNRAKNLERFARIIPKLQGSLLYIEQRVEGVPTILQDFAQSHISCTNPGSVIADLPGDRISIRSVPKPHRIPYRTGEAGFFDLEEDFDWTGLFRALRYDPDLLLIEEAKAPTQGERILRFLKEEEIRRKGGETVRCLDCSHEWVPRSTELPDRCPKCMSRDPFHLKEKA